VWRRITQPSGVGCNVTVPNWLGLAGRNWWILAGAITLEAYGLLVNQTRLDFGRLMGVYIAVFFTVSQIVAWVMFRQVPDSGIALGGGLVILGGILMMRP